MMAMIERQRQQLHFRSQMELESILLFTSLFYITPVSSLILYIYILYTISPPMSQSILSYIFIGKHKPPTAVKTLGSENSSPYFSFFLLNLLEILFMN